APAGVVALFWRYGLRQGFMPVAFDTDAIIAAIENQRGAADGAARGLAQPGRIGRRPGEHVFVAGAGIDESIAGAAAPLRGDADMTAGRDAVDLGGGSIRA